MLKYLRFYISPFFLLLAIIVFLQGGMYPLILFCLFDIMLIAGDYFFRNDIKTYDFKYPVFLNLSLYLNLPLLYVLVFLVLILLSNQTPVFVVDFFNALNIDFIAIKNSYTIYDKISAGALTVLFIGIGGTVPAHELTHRKQKRFDMFVGNWMLALSWDCAFAIEHVHGHHKNVCLEDDPATAKRGENIYAFVLRAIIKEQKDAWKIEISRLKRRGFSFIGINNKMLTGYLRSIIVTAGTYLLIGLNGMLLFLLLAFIAKVFLEAINYTEHYGLVRQPGQPVYPRHSWNSNNTISTIFLYNLTRHSAHHEKANVEFWDLKAYNDAPCLPFGYLSMLYMVIFAPFIYHKVMIPKLIDWDDNYASESERKIASRHNMNSGIGLLQNRVYE